MRASFVFYLHWCFACRIWNERRKRKNYVQEIQLNWLIMGKFTASFKSFWWKFKSPLLFMWAFKLRFRIFLMIDPSIFSTNSSNLSETTHTNNDQFYDIDKFVITSDFANKINAIQELLSLLSRKLNLCTWLRNVQFPNLHPAVFLRYFINFSVSWF